MQPDTGYKHWQGAYDGIWRRRMVIAWNGLRGCLQGRLMKGIVTVCWIAALIQTFILFSIGQLLVTDSFIVRLIGYADKDVKDVVNGFIAWLQLYPEISVGAVQNILFFFFTTMIDTLTLVGITIAIPHLITRDLSSNAMIIYSSKAVSRLDYLIGKFSTLFGLMTLTWLGPVCVAWFLGNFLAPEWHFFWHSRIPLVHLFLYIVASMIVLSFIGMGISAVSSNSKITISVWLAVWLLGNAFYGLSRATQPWLKYLSFRYNLDQLALAIFNLRGNVNLVKDNIPLMGDGLNQMEERHMLDWMDPSTTGAIIGLTLMVIGAGIIISRKVSTE